MAAVGNVNEWKRPVWLVRVGEHQESQNELGKPPIRPGPVPAQSTAQGLHSGLWALTASVQKEEEEGGEPGGCGVLEAQGRQHCPMQQATVPCAPKLASRSGW